MRATRLFLRDDLVAIADRHGEHVEVDGVTYHQHQPGTVTYFTLSGALEIERWTYREMGMRNGPTIVPLELEAGLVEHGTPALGFRIALGDAKDHMRSCEEDMQADHRSPPSRSTLERMATSLGTDARRMAPRIEPRLRRAETVPAGAVAVSLGLDRTAVPMAEYSRLARRPPRGARNATRRTNVNSRIRSTSTTAWPMWGPSPSTTFTATNWGRVSIPARRTSPRRSGSSVP
jgi:hypothetical protein